MRLVIDGVEISEPKAGGKNPYLLDVGDLHITARCGQAAIGLAPTEATSVSVRLDRRGRKVADLLDHPLRAAAEIYDNNDELYAAGTVSSIEYGNDLVLEIDA